MARIVVDKYAGEALLKALSVPFVEVGNNLLNHLMQPKHGIARQANGAPLAFVFAPPR
ncbi:Uncharacterised protein [Enterobacter asburiae]|uniref:Uncharacterized protein n=1 Tax=Enterobacter asburiae TaxID=61645 RepID=A0A376F7Z1_ENTAS|nr:Uncharacterised protein [Enterobacter asburiae]